jgi:hypothetical protein
MDSNTTRRVRAFAAVGAVAAAAAGDAAVVDQCSG